MMGQMQVGMNVCYLKAWRWTEAEEGLREEGGCVQVASEAGKGVVRREDG